MIVGCINSKGNILVGTNNCMPPCWLDIQPGVTKREDVIKILRKREQSKEGYLTLLEDGIIRWQSLDGYNSYFYAAQNEFVTKTEVDLRSSSLRLDDLILTFGEPQKLDINNVEGGYFLATMFYPKKGLSFVVSGDKFDISTPNLKFYFNPDLVVLKGIFFNPMDDISAMINLLYASNTAPSALTNIQNWIGYGVYYK